MWQYKVGDVVLVMFPNQEDPSRSTLRFGIVIEDLEDEVELVFMTKQIHQKEKYPKSFIIKEGTKEYEVMGLTYTSLVCPSRVVVRKKIRLIPPPKGRCPRYIIEKILELKS